MRALRSLVTLSVLAGSVLTAEPAFAQTNVADFNLNPNAKAFAGDSSGYGSRPSGPINGDTNANYNYDANFYHSQLGDGAAWWYVDLGADYDISKLVFFYRTDCCPEQNDGNLLQIWANAPTWPNGGGSLFTAVLDDNNSGVFELGSPVTGRYVSIKSDAGGQIVAAELQVFGVEPSQSVTPEPASLVLLATGVAAIGAVARKRKATAG